MNVILGLSHFDRTYDATCKIGYAITSNLDVKIAFFFFYTGKEEEWLWNAYFAPSRSTHCPPINIFKLNTISLLFRLSPFILPASCLIFIALFTFLCTQRSIFRSLHLFDVPPHRNTTHFSPFPTPPLTHYAAIVLRVNVYFSIDFAFVHSKVCQWTSSCYFPPHRRTLHFYRLMRSAHFSVPWDVSLFA